MFRLKQYFQSLGFVLTEIINNSFQPYSKVMLYHFVLSEIS